MANENKDIIRVEDTEANLPTTLIAGQLGFATDTNKLGHLMQDGITMQWYTSTDDSWIQWTSVGWGGVTTDSPDGKFHIWTGSAGSVSADTNMNELVIENDGDCGMTILAPDIYDNTICFGSPSDSQGSIINWNFTDDEFKIDTIGEFKLYTNDGTVGFYVNDSQEALIATSLGIGIGMTTAASEVLEVGGNAKIDGHIYQTDDYNDKHIWGAFNQCSITHDNTDMVLNSQEAGSGNFAFNGGNIKIDDDHYIGLDSDTDLLQLVSGTLVVNGSVRVDDSAYVGCDSDTDLIQLTSGTALINGNIRVDDSAYVGCDSDTDLMQLLSGRVNVLGDITIGDNGYVGMTSDADLLRLTNGQLRVAGGIRQMVDNDKHYWGTGIDCSITYDGTDMVFDSQETGSGDFAFTNGNIDVEEDIYTVALSDYSSTSTISGWDSRTVTNIFYKKLGKTVQIYFYITGTGSAATAASFTVPYVANSSVVSNVTSMGYSNDNGSAAVGILALAASSQTVSVYPGLYASLWTASTQRDIVGQFTYETT